MKKRQELLKDLVRFNGDIVNLQHELSNFSWDADNPFLTVKKEDIFSALSKFINNNVSFSVIEDWANTLESRDDLEFENEELKEYIHELANPVLFGELTTYRLKELLANITVNGI